LPTQCRQSIDMHCVGMHRVGMACTGIVCVDIVRGGEMRGLVGAVHVIRIKREPAHLTSRRAPVPAGIDGAHNFTRTTWLMRSACVIQAPRMRAPDLAGAQLARNRRSAGAQSATGAG
jgi:hypothetical protein